MARNPLNIPADLALDLKLSLLAVVLGVEGTSVLRHYVETGRLELDVIPEWLSAAIAGPLGEAERILGEPLFELLVRAPSGVNLSTEAGHQEADAVRMVERMMGFAFALPWGVAQLKQLLEAGMGGNAPKAVIEALEKLPEDLGINWALGTTMANIFELSTGRPLAEAIAEQTRPFRFEWPQLRALLRQGHITQAEAEERFRKIGLRDGDMPLALKLDRALLSFSDLQQAFEWGIKDEGWVRQYAEHLGLDAEDVDVLVAIYLQRGQTAGGSILRSVAQKGFVEDHLTETQYRALLTEAHVPPDSIKLEIEAARLTKEWGRLQLTVSEIKTLHAQGQLDDHAALTRLVANGYTETDAQTLIDSWHVSTKAGKLGLSEAKILSYELGGLLSRNQAYQRLLGLGYRADDAAFLADNPSTLGGVFKYPLTPAAILAAVKVGDLEDAQARSLLAEAGMAPEEIDLRVKVAQHLGRRATKAKAATKALSESQVLEGLKFGLVGPSWALQELVLLGYTDADAAFLVALELTKLSGHLPEGWTVLN